MRPIYLEMNGFASFRAETVVDFAGADYFALVGPTGSGKSTVIDAMTFALYGSAPRWGRANSVQWALAPTANRATVRLVFDVGAERFQVAREVRRVGKQGPQQRTASLEKFDDPTQATADTDQVTVLASEVRDVTPAVETLLGLSFDDFTKAVVLPQGRFAEFLGATVGERQDILLKLLGAHQYDIVMRAAGARASDARTEVATANGRIEDLGGATQEAEDAAAERVAELQALGETVAGLADDLARAGRAAEQAEAARQAAAADLAGLDAVRMPDGIADLAERARATRETARARQAEAREAEAAYTNARAALEAGGDRADLTRLRERWAELADLRASLPDLAEADVRARDEAARVAALRDEREHRWTEALAAEGEARRGTEAATAELRSLGRPAIPVGAVDDDDLPDLVAAAAEAVDEAAARLADAELAHASARDALREAGDAVTLSAAVAAAERAVEAAARVADLREQEVAASAARDAAEAAVGSTEETLSGARETARHARLLATAADLRGGLAVGHDCPVCAATVATLPPPIDAGAAAAADVAVGDAERAWHDARDGLTRATGALETAARDRVRAEELLATLLPDGADPAARLSAAQAGLEAWSTAQQAAAEAEAAAVASREAWITARVAAASLNAHRAAAALAPVRARLDDAVAARDEARAAARAADEASVLAGGAVTRATRRAEELRTELDGAATLAEVDAALVMLTDLEAAERAAMAAFTAAGAARDAATAAEEALTAELGAADELLRATRAPLVPLGAPAVDATDLPGAWATLIGWAADARGTAEAALMAAGVAVSEAESGRERAAAALVGAAVEAGIEVGGPGQAVAAVANQTGRAADALARIRRERERLGELVEQRDAAQEREQVAKLLADHLSAKKFQRWLAGAALDVLVEAASASLLELSGGQFSLTHEKGEFFVIDHADAEARRSVRTLSGGETFQASLALALALSAELSSMSATAARLDSIFLDEGFGSLDPESLEVVALTLERLAQGDRLVGVVTHVAALAERVPTRFVVARDSRSSSVRREG